MALAEYGSLNYSCLIHDWKRSDKQCPRCNPESAKEYIGSTDEIKEKFLVENEDSSVMPKIDKEYWRYHFTGLAMQSIVSNTEQLKMYNNSVSTIAAAAVKYADACLTQLERKEIS